jgi:predicted metallopeptidase
MQEFSHIDPNRLMICLSSTRSGGVHGIFAKIHPLRFAGGNRTKQVRRGRRSFTCAMPVIERQGEEMLYIIYFLFPRFFDLSFREKLITIFHELFHISPSFDGDIRRFPGRNYAHGSSTNKYNAAMATLVERYLAGLEDENLVGFLNQDLSELRAAHRTIVGRKMKAPRLSITPC